MIKKWTRSILKLIGYLLLVPVIYILLSLLLSSITVEGNQDSDSKVASIFLSTNGVHLEIIIPTENLGENLKQDLIFDDSDRYVSFGWGDEEFYLNTPQWRDLTFSRAFNAAFLNSSTLIHITKYNNRRAHWIEIPVDEQQLSNLTDYIMETFKLDQEGRKIHLPNSGYTAYDEFYKAEGSYSCFQTCNSWVNSAFKQSELRACLWTPFDFSLINKYK